MAVLQLPVNADSSSYEFKTTLEGKDYTFALKYNTRKDRWIMDISAEDGTPLLMGVPLVLGTDFLKQYQDSSLPTGKLLLLDIKESNVECGRDDLGLNYLLLYEESE